jgi:hypothetical protein
MLDEVEAGRHFKYSVQGVRLQYCSPSPCNHRNMSISPSHPSSLHPCIPVSLGSVILKCVGREETTHTHLFSLCVACEQDQNLERTFKMPNEYKIQYTLIKVLPLPHIQQRNTVKSLLNEYLWERLFVH